MRHGQIIVGEPANDAERAVSDWVAWRGVTFHIIDYTAKTVTLMLDGGGIFDAAVVNFAGIATGPSAADIVAGVLRRLKAEPIVVGSRGFVVDAGDVGVRAGNMWNEGAIGKWVPPSIVEVVVTVRRSSYSFNARPVEGGKAYVAERVLFASREAAEIEVESARRDAVKSRKRSAASRLLDLRKKAAELRTELDGIERKDADLCKMLAAEGIDGIDDEVTAVADERRKQSEYINSVRRQRAG